MFSKCVSQDNLSHYNKDIFYDGGEGMTHALLYYIIKKVIYIYIDVLLSLQELRWR